MGGGGGEEGVQKRPVRREGHVSQGETQVTKTIVHGLVGSTTWCNAKVVSEDVELARTEIPGGGVRGTLYLTLHCHHQKDSCINLRCAAVKAILMFH